MNVQAITNTALNLEETPFAEGFNAVFFNNSGAAATLNGSDDGVTYTAVVTAAATGTMTNVTLQKYMKLSAAATGAYLLA